MKVYVAAWIGEGNAGDDWIFHSLCRLLESRGASEIAFACGKSWNRAEEARRRPLRRGNPAAIWRAIRRSDLVVFGGGGLLQDETSIWNLPFHLFPLWLARWHRKRLYVLGVGAGPLRSSWSRRLTRWALRPAERIMTRDKPSTDLLEACGVADIITATDLTFTRDATQTAPTTTPDRRRIVVALRPFRGGGGFLPASIKQRKSPPEMIRVYAEALRALARETGCALFFLSLDRKKDIPFHQAIIALLPGEIEVEHQSAGTLDEAIALFAMAEGAVCMRFHSVVAALWAGTPMVTLGYSPKVSALSEEWNSKGLLQPTPKGLDALSETYTNDRPSRETLGQALQAILARTDRYDLLSLTAPTA